ncbi:uncharacterized protein TRAVEDRAFT_137698, partial [Trametes versicolor FP-101664 SS1]
GSIFNHSERPNVSYTCDSKTESIRYITTRTVLPDEELCIFYGHKLWFDPVDATATDYAGAEIDEEMDDGWGGLASLDGVDDGGTLDELFNGFENGSPEEIVLEDALPFTRLKLTPEDEEEEDMDAIRKEEAWAVDLPDPRLAAVMLKWLKQSGLDTPAMAHLKRIRKLDDKMSMVLILTREHPDPPAFPPDIDLPPPYILTVAKTSALTMTSLKLKSSLWPTIYTPRKKFEPEPWSRSKVRWACEAMKEVVKVARSAAQQDETPIAAYVPVPWDEETRVATRMLEPLNAHDTRQSAAHPLRHCFINLVRAVGELRASSTSIDPISPVPVPDVPSPAPAVDVSSSAVPLDPVDAALTPERSQTPSAQSQAEVRNGAHYLLTSLTLFTTHEPCVMCSMALLHSRVREVFYLFPIEKTGGCGSITCVPRLEGVNHRFAVNKWKLDGRKMEDWMEKAGLVVEGSCDA